MKEDIKRIEERIKETEERLMVSLAQKPNEDTLDAVLSILVRNPDTDNIADVMPNYHELFQQLTDAISEGEEMPELPDAQPSSDPEELAQELMELVTTRKTVLSLMQKANLLLKGHVNLSATLNMLEEDIFHIKHSLTEENTTSEPVGFDDIFEKLVADYEYWYKMRHEFGTIGLPTKFEQLDMTLDGLQQGIHLLGAAPSAGKTTLTLQIARNVAEAGFPVLFVSFEEPVDRLWHKNAANALSLTLKDVFGTQLGTSEDYREMLKTVRDRFQRLYITQGTSETTVQQIKVKAKQLMKKFDKDRCLIIIDYLQHWAQSKKGKTHQDFRLIVGDLAREIREKLAIGLGCPVLVISAQNRSGQGTADLASLKETSDLEYGADSIWFLTGEDDKKENNKKGKKNGQSDDDDEKVKAVVPSGAELCILQIAKNRFGATRKIYLAFFKAKGHMKEMKKGVDGVIRCE